VFQFWYMLVTPEYADGVTESNQPVTNFRLAVLTNTTGNPSTNQHS
jgi:hypothetical protein